MILDQWNSGRIRTLQSEAQKRYVGREAERTPNVDKLHASTPPVEVDTNSRVRIRRTFVDARDGLALERLIGNSDLLPVSYMEVGLSVARSVCRIEIRDAIGRVLGYGTGFLVSPSLIVTNNHVLENPEGARYGLAQFNCQTDVNLMPLPIISFRLDPDRFFLTDASLDFTLVAVEQTASDGSKVSDFGRLPLHAEPGKVLVGEYVSIIQHPEGGPKAVAIRENEVVDVFDDFVHYETDTQPGSSGSPVFNDSWVVVALHHSGVPDPTDRTKFIANEGIRISSIVRHLSEQRMSLSAGERALVDEAILGIPSAPSGTTEMKAVTQDLEWYEGTGGYDPAFLGREFPVPFPSMTAEMERDVAVTKDGKRALSYTHFSVVMSKSRRLAYCTAVNIDGGHLDDIRREDDRWYFDPRIDRTFQSGPELYANNDLDRGHLVRRLDPDWGKDAERANEDTFHFTNCSPQHKNLNRKTWQNLEDYILKNAGRYDLKVTVFTGPVFRADDMVYRGDFQIPAEYWKVVVMVKDDGQLSATAYIQTQKNLIADLEFAYGEYRTYQIPVSRVEALTGLDFGNLRPGDPLANLEGASGRLIERAESIRL